MTYKKVNGIDNKNQSIDVRRSFQVLNPYPQTFDLAKEYPRDKHSSLFVSDKDNWLITLAIFSKAYTIRDPFRCSTLGEHLNHKL